MTHTAAHDGGPIPAVPTRPVAIIVMGTQGVGKTTIGTRLASQLGVPFIDGDRLHPARNVERMASGQPLSDEDRAPWLRIVGEALAEHQASGGAVIACSALKRSYRDVLRAHVPTVYVVEPWGPIELVQDRVRDRTHEYMPPELLASQYETLEPLADDERGIRVNVAPTPERIVETVLEHYQRESANQEQS